MDCAADDDGDDGYVDVTPELLWTLADECSRCVVKKIHEDEVDEISLSDLAAFVAGEHSGVYRNEPQSAAIQLHHSSLPRLAEHGIIDYDSDELVIRNREDVQLPPDLTEQVITLDDH